MIKKQPLISLVLAIFLLSGCGAQPATDAPSPTSAPPLTTATLAADTPAPPPTADSIAPTATPEPEPPPASPTPADAPAPSGGQPLTLTIVYDNYLYQPGLRTAWGFAAYIEYGDHILLFDTGGDGYSLMSNMDELGLDPLAIEAVVLSHAHGDHTQGLPALLATGVKPPVYMLPGFPAELKDEARAHTEVIEVTEPVEILPGVHTTGQIPGGFREQALVLETPEGSVVVTGCAHPGIVRLVSDAKEIVPGAIQLVVGGFHLGDLRESAVANIITNFRSLGVRQVSPTHCTGDEAIAIFAEEYGADYIQGGVGKVFVIGDTLHDHQIEARPLP